MSVSYKDYYKLLGVERSSPKEEIAKSYKKLARKYHPDLNPENKEAEEKFKELTEAYDVLKDAKKRKLYDQLGSNWKDGQNFQGAPGSENMHFNFNGQNFSGGDNSAFFEMLFGQAARAQTSRSGGFGPDPFSAFSSRQRKGQDYEAELVITLEDAFNGAKSNINIDLPDGPRALDVNIPAGIKNGNKLRLSEQGGKIAGGIAGDLFLRIRYAEHAYFQVEDNNILYKLAISPWEAVLGTKVIISTLAGEIEMNIPAGTSSGKKFRLRGKGLASSAGKGDQFVHIQIKVPTELSDEERTLWESLAEKSSFKARD